MMACIEKESDDDDIEKESDEDDIEKESDEDDIEKESDEDDIEKESDDDDNNISFIGIRASYLFTCDNNYTDQVCMLKENCYLLEIS